MYTYCGNNSINFIDPTGHELVMLKYIAEKNGLIVEWDEKYKCTRVTDPKTGLYKEYNAWRYTISNGRMLVDSAEIAKDFGLEDGPNLYHQPGDRFETADDAAMAWGLTYNDNSISSDREYISWIYNSNNSSSYTFTKPERASVFSRY